MRVPAPSKHSLYQLLLAALVCEHLFHFISFPLVLPFSSSFTLPFGYTPLALATFNVLFFEIRISQVH